MGLLRTIVGLILLVILAHVALVYFAVEQSANVATQAVYGLGILLESPASFVLDALGSNLPDFVDPNGFFSVALTAAALYFIIYVLLGIGQD